MFLQDPADDTEKPFYESEKDEDEEEEMEEDGKPKPKPYMMDSDHRLILKQCKPLLNSRNAAVSCPVISWYSKMRSKVLLIVCSYKAL